MTVSSEENAAAKDGQSLQCPVCHQALSLRLARGRKSGKPFLMVLCLQDGRHFRGFVGDRDFVRQVIGRLEVGHQDTRGQSR